MFKSDASSPDFEHQFYNNLWYQTNNSPYVCTKIILIFQIVWMWYNLTEITYKKAFCLWKRDDLIKNFVIILFSIFCQKCETTWTGSLQPKKKLLKTRPMKKKTVIHQAICSRYTHLLRLKSPVTLHAIKTYRSMVRI